METSYEEYYKKQLEAGLRYQDFIVKKFLQKGIVLIPFSSREYQYKEGETTGKLVEIKFDGKFKTTKNLWIEFGERSNPTVQMYSESGIFRDSIWYLIGDYNEAFVFHTKVLLNELSKRTVIENSTKTSKGYLLKRWEAQQLCSIHCRHKDHELKLTFMRRFFW